MKISYIPKNALKEQLVIHDEIEYLGFTGRREGVSLEQVGSLEELIKNTSFKVAVHGDCIGADAVFHDVVRKLKPDVKIEIYPALHPDFKANKHADLSHVPMKALERDKIMANKVEFMIAMPSTNHEILRSGTWATIRYSRKSNTVKRIIIINPNGDCIIEE